MGRIGQSYEALHEKGAWRKRQRPTVPSANGAPEMPPYLDEEEQKVWESILGTMAEYNTLDRIDSFVLADLCQFMVSHKKMMAKIKMDREDSLTLPLFPIKKHPLFPEADSIYKNIIRLRSDLGMTPKARLQMNITQAIEVEKTVEKNAALSLLVAE